MSVNILVEQEVLQFTEQNIQNSTAKNPGIFSTNLIGSLMGASESLL